MPVTNPCERWLTLIWIFIVSAKNEFRLTILTLCFVENICSTSRQITWLFKGSDKLLRDKSCLT